eukprot:NODE_38_length_35257_cov_0.939047.p10 type:complete len:308 gc:universal NODE_38_length_35257_cov_0.939047:24320-23397(-)
MEFKQKAIDLQKKPFLSFGWTPDHENIGIYYQRAANVFANTDLNEAIICYEMATEYLLKAGIIFEAAKSQELLAKLCKRSGKLKECSAAFGKAGDLFKQLTQFDTSSEMYSNSAQAFESQKDLKNSGDMYVKAVDALIDNDKGVLSHDIFKKSTGFFLKNSLYKEAINLYKKQILVLKGHKKHGVSKVQLSIIIIYLGINEKSNAKQFLNECKAALGGSSATMALLGGSSVELPTELAAAEKIIESLENGDAKLLSSTINDQLMFLDSEISKIATGLGSKLSESKLPDISSTEPTRTYDLNEEEGFA